MDDGQILIRALEIARMRFPDSPRLHAPFVASVLYLMDDGQRWHLPHLGHEGPTVWELALFRRFPAEQLPESGVSLERAVKMITRSRVFGRPTTRHFRCWREEMPSDDPSAVRTFSHC